MGFDIKRTKSERDSMNSLRDGLGSFAVVRGDILYLAQQGEAYFDFKEYYILGKLNKISRLFLVSKKGMEINSEEDFRAKSLSIGNFYNLSSFYFKKLLKYDRSIRLGIDYRFYTLEESLDAMKNRTYNGRKSNLDLFFLFDDSEKSSTIRASGVAKENPIPQKMMDILLTNKGLERKGSSIETEYYLIVRKDVESKSRLLIDMVLKLNRKGLLIDKDKVNKNLGMLQPDIQSILNGVDIDKKVEELAKKFKNENKKSLKHFLEIKKSLSYVPNEAMKLSKASLQEIYKAEAVTIQKSVALEREKIGLLKKDFLIAYDDKKVEKLEALIHSLQEKNLNLQTYKNKLEEVVSRIKIKLLEEKEKEQESSMQLDVVNY